MFYWLIKITLGPIVRLLWIRKIEGSHNIPRKGPLLVAANHSSYFDFISLVSVYPQRIRFLAAEVFYKSAFWKPIMILTGQIKVDRKSNDKTATIEAVRYHLKKGEIIGLFPEGTRSRSGKIQKAYTGVAKFALENRVNILPVAIRNSYEIMSPHEKKPKFKKIIDIIYLPELRYEDFKNCDPEYITHKLLMGNIAKEVSQEYPEK